VLNHWNGVTRFYNAREKSRPSIRSSGNAFKDGFRLFLLALETLVQLAAFRIIKVLVAQVSKEAFLETIPQGSTSVLVPKKRTLLGESHVSEACSRVLTSNHSTFLYTLLGRRHHVRIANERRQVTGTAANAATSNVSNGGYFVEVCSLKRFVRLESVGTGA